MRESGRTFNMARLTVVALLGWLVSNCGGTSDASDAAVNDGARVEGSATSDVGAEAARDAALEATMDGGPEGASDAPTDAPVESSLDASPDAPFASPDAPSDAPFQDALPDGTAGGMTDSATGSPDASPSVTPRFFRPRPWCRIGDSRGVAVDDVNVYFTAFATTSNEGWHLSGTQGLRRDDADRAVGQ
jgi:hypothetical protein